MTPPTRLERLVHEEAMYLSGNMAKRLPLADVVNLLRREQARVRRKVNKLRDDRFEAYRISGAQRQPFLAGYRCACLDLLAALRKDAR